MAAITGVPFPRLLELALRLELAQALHTLGQPRKAALQIWLAARCGTDGGLSSQVGHQLHLAAASEYGLAGLTVLPGGAGPVRGWPAVQRTIMEALLRQAGSPHAPLTPPS